jgi:outer membrane protein OmpA-like peptidoglycan-associated protein
MRVHPCLRAFMLPALLLTAMLLTGCNTMAGFGRDVQSAGRWVERVGGGSPESGSTASSPEASMAPAAGQAAALPPREDIVFFSLGSAQLTPDARNAIREAVADARQHSLARVQVTGYTDTLGAADANERLSWRRADAVAQEIAAQGVPRDQIDVVGRGETDLPVPTSDNVAEPQNRRVAIDFQSLPPAATGG